MKKFEKITGKLVLEKKVDGFAIHDDVCFVCGTLGVNEAKVQDMLGVVGGSAGGVEEQEDEVTIDQVQELYEFLQGKRKQTVTSGGGKITWDAMPMLSKQVAFNIIYYLQEVLQIIPDNYEQCHISDCGELFDSDNSGCSAMYCDVCGCQHDYYSYENGCEDCPEMNQE